MSALVRVRLVAAVSVIGMILTFIVVRQSSTSPTIASKQISEIPDQEALSTWELEDKFINVRNSKYVNIMKENNSTELIKNPNYVEIVPLNKKDHIKPRFNPNKKDKYFEIDKDDDEDEEEKVSEDDIKNETEERKQIPKINPNGEILEEDSLRNNKTIAKKRNFENEFYNNKDKDNILRNMQFNINSLNSKGKYNSKGYVNYDRDYLKPDPKIIDNDRDIQGKDDLEEVSGRESFRQSFTTMINDLFDDHDLEHLRNFDGKFKAPGNNLFQNDLSSNIYSAQRDLKKQIAQSIYLNKMLKKQRESNTPSRPFNFTSRTANYNRTLWHREQQRRRIQLQRVCRNYDINTNLETLFTRRSYLSNILVDDDHQALYCYVPKVACTQWKRLYMVMTGKVLTSDPENIPHMKAHFGSGLKTLASSGGSREEIISKLQKYTKFMLVRHPLERLVSAFKNKFEENSTDASNFKMLYGVEMMKYSRRANDIPESGASLKFWEFLNYLTKINPSFLQEHWARYNQLCHPCIINYDFIGKYESLEEDSNFILDHIGAPKNIKFPKYKPSKTSEQKNSYLSTVPANIIRKIIDLFNIDFLMFNYDKRIKT